MALPFDPPVEPMLAKAADALPSDDGWLFEPKWDGFRALVFRDGDEVYTQSRDLKPLDRYFPELADPLRAALPDRCVLDGEVVIARDGALQFESLLLRIHPAASRVNMLAAGSPASFVAWDLLALGDEDLRGTPQGERRARLESVLGDVQPPVHLTPATRDRATAREWFEKFEGAGLDGVVAKRLDAPYQPGKRAMLKIKHQRTADCVVAGFRWHKNGPGTHIGSLLLGLFDDDGKLNHAGITSSFTWDGRAELADELAPLRENALADHPWREWAEWAMTGDADASGQRLPGATSRWNRGKDLSWEPLRAERVVEVAYDHLQGSRFRHATTFKRWRPDKPPEECRYDQLEETVPFLLASIFGERGDMTLRLGLVGGGWISRLHLEALARLERTELVGVVAGSRGTADEVTAQWGGTSYDDLDRMIEAGRPDVVYVAVPPHTAVAIGERLVAHRIPFLTENPLAATDWDGPVRLADAIEQSRLVVAVGYHLRALDIMAEVRSRLAERPAQLVVARWLDSTPDPSWWGRADEGGGQVIEQATHLYDLARYLVGEATVVGAASTRDPQASVPSVDVADSSAAVIRFESGAIGSFANTRRISTPVIEVEIVSDGLLTTLTKHRDRGQGDWHATFDDGTVIRAISAECDPYEKQAAAFLDAVEWADPGGVLSSYEDALKTDRLTRAVVAATGAPG